MRKGGVKCSATSNENKMEKVGLSDGVTSPTDGVIVVGSLGTQSFCVLYLRVMFARICKD